MGECEIQTAGGLCWVCQQRIAPGRAVQGRTGDVRHSSCERPARKRRTKRRTGGRPVIYRVRGAPRTEFIF